MARRYSNINQGTELKKAQEALETYRKTKTTKRGAADIPSVTSTRPTTSAVVKPFDRPSDEFVIVSITKKSNEKLRAALPGRISQAEADFTNAIKLSGFRPARIHFFEPSAGVPSYVKSKITGLNYIKYPGDSYSSPFGRLSANEEESTAATAVKRDVLELSSKDYKRAWYESERIKV